MSIQDSRLTLQKVIFLTNIFFKFLLGLGYYSEQPFEAMHHDAKVLWERVKVGTGHPDVERVLKDFVVSYNSKHL